MHTNSCVFYNNKSATLKYQRGEGVYTKLQWKETARWVTNANRMTAQLDNVQRCMRMECEVNAMRCHIQIVFLQSIYTR